MEAHKNKYGRDYDPPTPSARDTTSDKAVIKDLTTL
jgi:hypothetical protein